MLQVSNIDKYYGDAPVLRGVSFTLGHGKKAGVVGPNGSGKSTLMRVIVGLERPDAGSVTLTPGARLGYLRQGFLGDEAAPVMSILERDGAVWPAYQALEGATDDLAAHPNAPDILAHYETTATVFEEAGGYARLAEVEDVLRGLDLAGLDPTRPMGTLSGGQKTRLALAALLLGAPDLLLLDEPTNHLDVDALRWLEGFVAGFPGAALIVSHDRSFLDATVGTILELDDHTHTLRTWPGGYSAYAEARRREEERQLEEYRDQQAEVARVERDIRRMSAGARSVEAKTQADYKGQTRAVKGAARTRAAKVARTAKVRERKLDKELSEHTLEKPKAGWTLKLDFAPPPGGARDVLRVEGLYKSFGERHILAGVDLALRHGERVVLTGPNGGGKSTLLKIVSGELAPDAGTARLGAGVTLGYYGQEQAELDPRRTPLELIRAAAPMTETEARALLHAYLFAGDDVFTPVGRLSYGERARLVLARLALSGANLLLLDEPTNHLDIPSRERFEAALAQFEGTVLAVLHDRYSLARLATRVVELRDGVLRERCDVP